MQRKAKAFHFELKKGQMALKEFNVWALGPTLLFGGNRDGNRYITNCHLLGRVSHPSCINDKADTLAVNS